MAGKDSCPKERWLFTEEQLENSPSRHAGYDAAKELSCRQETAMLIQYMGHFLRAERLCITTAMVYIHRFFVFHSFTDFRRNDIAVAALFLACKVEGPPRKVKEVLEAYHSWLKKNYPTVIIRQEEIPKQEADLILNETVLLLTLGFDVGIDHPHAHIVRYFHDAKDSRELARTAYLTATGSLMLTTLCLKYKPSVVACFCIHFARRWSNEQIPLNDEGKPWFWKIDQSVTLELLEKLMFEFLSNFDKCPPRLQGYIFQYNSQKRECEGIDSPRQPSEQSASSSPQKEKTPVALKELPASRMNPSELPLKHQPRQSHTLLQQSEQSVSRPHQHHRQLSQQNSLETNKVEQKLLSSSLHEEKTSPAPKEILSSHLNPLDFLLKQQQLQQQTHSEHLQQEQPDQQMSRQQSSRKNLMEPIEDAVQPVAPSFGGSYRREHQLKELTKNGGPFEPYSNSNTYHNESTSSSSLFNSQASDEISPVLKDASSSSLSGELTLSQSSVQSQQEIVKPKHAKLSPVRTSTQEKCSVFCPVPAPASELLLGMSDVSGLNVEESETLSSPVTPATAATAAISHEKTLETYIPELPSAVPEVEGRNPDQRNSSSMFLRSHKRTHETHISELPFVVPEVEGHISDQRNSSSMFLSRYENTPGANIPELPSTVPEVEGLDCAPDQRKSSLVFPSNNENTHEIRIPKSASPVPEVGSLEQISDQIKSSLVFRNNYEDTHAANVPELPSDDPKVEGLERTSRKSSPVLPWSDDLATFVLSDNSASTSPAHRKYRLKNDKLSSPASPQIKRFKISESSRDNLIPSNNDRNNFDQKTEDEDKIKSNHCEYTYAHTEKDRCRVNGGGRASVNDPSLTISIPLGRVKDALPFISSTSNHGRSRSKEERSSNSVNLQDQHYKSEISLSNSVRPFFKSSRSNYDKEPKSNEEISSKYRHKYEQKKPTDKEKGRSENTVNVKDMPSGFSLKLELSTMSDERQNDRYRESHRNRDQRTDFDGDGDGRRVKKVDSNRSSLKIKISKALIPPKNLSRKRGRSHDKNSSPLKKYFQN